MSTLEALISLSIISATSLATVDYVSTMSAEIEATHEQYLTQQKENIKKARSLSFGENDAN